MTQSQKVIPSLPLLARDLENFTRLLSVEDARVMVDLLKLAVAKRVGEKGKETLAAVLTTMAKTNTEVEYPNVQRERERKEVGCLCVCALFIAGLIA